MYLLSAESIFIEVEPVLLLLRDHLLSGIRHIRRRRFVAWPTLTLDEANVRLLACHRSNRASRLLAVTDHFVVEAVSTIVVAIVVFGVR